VTVTLDHTIDVQGFGFKSANDVPARDPDEVDVYTGASYKHHVATFKLDFKRRRWHTLRFSGVDI
jgi:hypothetical protein